MQKDLHEILGVKKDATETEIKAAYRKLALKWHPDKHKGDAEAEKKFKEINVAYEILSDKQKRQQYETFGSTGGGPSGFSGGNAGFGGFDFSGFSGNGASGFADIFETFFGGSSGGHSRSRKSGPIRGNDIEASIKISFNDAIFGCEKDLEIVKSGKCDHCNGTGAEPNSPIVSCGACSGTGEIRSIKNTILGQVSTSRTCDECDGEGKVPEKKCSVCHGTTRTRSKERVKVKIPAGVDNGSTIRLAGKGEGGIKGGPNGDLYINLQVEPSKNFIRDGYDLHSELKIHLVQAVIGDEVEVETIDEKTNIKIPPGTTDGKVFKISGKGVPKLGSSGRGNHLVKIKIDIPQKLSKREKELYLELSKEAGLDIKKNGLFW